MHRVWNHGGGDDICSKAVVRHRCKDAYIHACIQTYIHW